MELDRRQIQYDLHFTNEPMEAVDVAKMGIEAGFSHIVAMGGDGTVNEVANGLLGSDATLAVIPAGTGNDFIRMLGIPGNPMQAIARWLQDNPEEIKPCHNIVRTAAASTGTTLTAANVKQVLDLLITLWPVPQKLQHTKSDPDP